MFHMAFQRNYYLTESDSHMKTCLEKGGVENQLLPIASPIRCFPKIGHYNYLRPIGVVEY